MVRRFLDRDPAERWLLACALLVVAATRVGLQFLTVAAVRRRLGRSPGPPPERATDRAATPDDIGMAVRRASRAVPGASCLVQAVAGEALLRRRGYPARLAMGLARDGAGRLSGHAWLECGSQVVVGGAEASRYVRLAAVERVSPRPASEG